MPINPQRDADLCEQHPAAALTEYSGEHRYRHSVDHRRPEYLDRVRHPDPTEKADGGSADTQIPEPGRQRGEHQQEGQTGGETEEQHRNNPRVVIHRKCFAPAGRRLSDHPCYLWAQIRRVGRRFEFIIRTIVHARRICLIVEAGQGIRGGESVPFSGAAIKISIPTRHSHDSGNVDNGKKGPRPLSRRRMPGTANASWARPAAGTCCVPRRSSVWVVSYSRFDSLPPFASFPIVLCCALLRRNSTEAATSAGSPCLPSSPTWSKRPQASARFPAARST